MNTRHISRRQVIGSLGAAALLTACDSSGSSTDKNSSANHQPTPPNDVGSGASPANNGLNNLQCRAQAGQTEGPYFVDERLTRSDIREDTSTGQIVAGVPLVLDLTFSNIDGQSCVALPNALVDIWHCDPQGVYSDVAAANGIASSIGKKFLRGNQTTDAAGHVQFTTVYPGWYPGRAVHIHFKVRWTDEAGKSQSFTSQLYFDDAISDTVLANAPYKNRARDTRNSDDRIFARGGKGLTLQLVAANGGYRAGFKMGLSKG